MRKRKKFIKSDDRVQILSNSQKRLKVSQSDKNHFIIKNSFIIEADKLSAAKKSPEFQEQVHGCRRKLFQTDGISCLSTSSVILNEKKSTTVSKAKKLKDSLLSEILDIESSDSEMTVISKKWFSTRKVEEAVGDNEINQTASNSCSSRMKASNTICNTYNHPTIKLISPVNVDADESLILTEFDSMYDHPTSKKLILPHRTNDLSHSDYFDNFYNNSTIKPTCQVTVGEDLVASKEMKPQIELPFIRLISPLKTDGLSVSDDINESHTNSYINLKTAPDDNDLVSSFNDHSPIWLISSLKLDDSILSHEFNNVYYGTSGIKLISPMKVEELESESDSEIFYNLQTTRLISPPNDDETALEHFLLTNHSRDGEKFENRPHSVDINSNSHFSKNSSIKCISPLKDWRQTEEINCSASSENITNQNDWLYGFKFPSQKNDDSVKSSSESVLLVESEEKVTSDFESGNYDDKLFEPQEKMESSFGSLAIRLISPLEDVKCNEYLESTHFDSEPNFKMRLISLDTSDCELHQDFGKVDDRFVWNFEHKLRFESLIDQIQQQHDSLNSNAKEGASTFNNETDMEKYFTKIVGKEQLSTFFKGVNIENNSEHCFTNLLSLEEDE
ncbi:hypothetical protein CHUAL_007403 [Chamberlinius hualienensis]